MKVQSSIKTSDSIKINSIIKDKEKLFIPGLFLLSRLFFIFIILASGSSYNTVLHLFDAEHYINIASNGYYHESLTAFFPVMPILIKHIGIAGVLVINNFLFLATLYLFDLLNIKKETLILIAMSPVSFFTMLLYTESIFLFLTTLIYYMHIKDKNRIVIGILMGLSVCTRSAASMLFFAIFIGMVIDFFKKKTTIAKILMTYIPATLISLIYPIFLQVRFNNWKLFMDAQFTYWVRISSNIFKTIAIEIKMLCNGYPFIDLSDEILVKGNEIVILTIFTLIMILLVNEIYSIVKSAKITSENIILILYVIFSIVSFYATIRDPYLDSPTVSFHRYLYGMFPIYIWHNKTRVAISRTFLYVTLIITLVTSFMFASGLYFY